MRQLILLSLCATFLCTSCETERNADLYEDAEYSIISSALTLPQEVADYELKLQEHLLEPGTLFPTLSESSLAVKQNNNNRATLGRVLFYDKDLSQDRNIACGTCHTPDKAFSDGKQFSDGVDGQTTSRNSLALATTLSFRISYNPVNQQIRSTAFSWDDSAHTLEEQIHKAFNSQDEMNITPEEIAERLTEKEFYPILFERAYGDSEMTIERTTAAIKEFVDAISSKSTKFDVGLEKSPSFLAENDFINFSESENLGKRIFNANCASCHTAKHNFTVKTNANNGLELNYADNGIGGRLNRPDHFGIFKVPFLRNVGVTGPYMHDGRFATLEEVVDHYSDNIVQHDNLSDELKNEDGSVKRLHLSKTEKTALVDYLHTLTDYALLSDEKFADPFIR